MMLKTFLTRYLKKHVPVIFRASGEMIYLERTFEMAENAKAFCGIPSGQFDQRADSAVQCVQFFVKEDELRLFVLQRLM